MPPEKKEPPPSLLDDALSFLGTVWQEMAAFARWSVRHPWAALALAGIAVVCFYFYNEVQSFKFGTKSTFGWFRMAWYSNGEYGYGYMVPLIALGLFFYHRNTLRQTLPGNHWPGLVFLLGAVFLYVVAIRCLNPRTALLSIPALLVGIIWFGWGRDRARVLLFPCAFLLFMIPFGALEQATFRLQFLITDSIGFLTRLFHIPVLAVGTTLTPLDGSWNFEIAEGCSGIRSLMAMVMITAIYVHLTQDRLWKKGLIFAGSLGFAIIGNIGRIFSIVLLARYYDPKLAAGLYHEYSGFIFFPIAILTMLGFAHVVNVGFPWLLQKIRR